ncbi:MAG: hypothetical protein P4L99_17165 [Chthoniobacter sp.]|nr:hypothetical protein [Chthoniobacter sp.]
MANNQSKLEPFRELIAAERHRRTPYRRIAELLAERGVQVDYSTIHAFVKVRSKPPRKVITMLKPAAQEVAAEPQFSGAAAETTQPPVHPEHSGQLEAIQRLKAAKPEARDPGKGLPGFEEGTPLERLSEDEARRIRENL